MIQQIATSYDPADHYNPHLLSLMIQQKLLLLLQQNRTLCPAAARLTPPRTHEG
jgi:hypothetical protein